MDLPVNLNSMPDGAVGTGSQDQYYWPDGSLKWGCPIDVGHLIAQLQTLDPGMKVSSVMFINTREGTKPRAYGLSMSYERWDEGGWLNFKLPGPKCLAIWATTWQEVIGLAPVQSPAKPSGDPTSDAQGGQSL